MSSSIHLTEYLFRRLYQLGIRALHGVPGDFNLTALDYVEKCHLLGYAADGYARTKGIGAVITTFGVGELSLVNAIGGSRAENVPVVHIVGTPSTKSQKQKQILHHTFGDGNFEVFRKVTEQVTVAQVDLRDIQTAAGEIDRVLRECWVQSRPVYIMLPTDMVDKEVDESLLDAFLDLSYPVNEKGAEGSVVGLVLDRLYRAQRPVLLIDGGVRRCRLTAVIDSLVKKSKLPTFVAPMGKGLVDETLPNFAGVYSGDGSFDSVREYIEASDCVLSIGGIQSDFNTTGFTYKIPPEALLDLHTNFSIINNTRYDLDMPSLVQAIEAHLDPSHMKTTSVNLPFSRIRANAPSSQDQYPPGTITQEYLWSKLSDWVQPHDILITETGTSYLGDWDTQFKSGMTAISQTLWSSIGYALPAAQGAALASRELGSKQRVILFEGDGSFQLTAQAISDMVRHKLDLIVFLLNNDGYTIERWVHGMEAGYNDISGWRYTDIPRAMGGDGSLVKTFKVATKEEMEALWMDPEFWNRKGLRFVEVKMPQQDAPITLKKLGAAAAKMNAIGT